MTEPWLDRFETEEKEGYLFSNYLTNLPLFISLGAKELDFLVPGWEWMVKDRKVHPFEQIFGEYEAGARWFAEKSVGIDGLARGFILMQFETEMERELLDRFYVSWGLEASLRRIDKTKDWRVFIRLWITKMFHR